MEKKNLRPLSKQEFSGEATVDNIKIGALQRIADACELMARDREKMERELQWYKNGRESYKNLYEESLRRNIALKGVITKLKKQLQATGEKESGK